MPGIYAIQNKTNGNMYVGKTKQQFKTRWYRHTTDLNRGKSECHILQRAWNKYGGKSGFEFKVIVDGEFLPDELKQWEEIFIKLYGDYNILKTSQPTDYSKSRNKKIGEAHKELWKDPKYRQQKIEALRSDHWDKYEEVKAFWCDKSNGRGGCHHPGSTIIARKFNMSTGTAKSIIAQIKTEDVDIIEAYNKQEIYNYWIDPKNSPANNRWPRPGRQALVQVFGISNQEASKLIQEFKIK